VKAVRQAWDAAVASIPLEVYAKDHPELAQSLNTFAGGKGA
jgi:ribulose-bisphosphate carboxylase large chain